MAVIYTIIPFFLAIVKVHTKHFIPFFMFFNFFCNKTKIYIILILAAYNLSRTVLPQSPRGTYPLQRNLFLFFCFPELLLIGAYAFFNDLHRFVAMTNFFHRRLLMF